LPLVGLTLRVAGGGPPVTVNVACCGTGVPLELVAVMLWAPGAAPGGMVPVTGVATPKVPVLSTVAVASVVNGLSNWMVTVSPGVKLWPTKLTPVPAGPEVGLTEKVGAVDPPVTMMFVEALREPVAAVILCSPLGAPAGTVTGCEKLPVALDVGVASVLAGSSKLIVTTALGVNPKPVMVVWAPAATLGVPPGQTAP